MAENTVAASELTASEIDQAMDAVILAIMADNDFSETEKVALEGGSKAQIKEAFKQDLRDATGAGGAMRGDEPNIRLTDEQIDYALAEYEFVAGVGYQDDPSTPEFDGKEQITMLRRKPNPDRTFDPDGGYVILVDALDYRNDNITELRAAAQIAGGNPEDRAQLATLDLAMERTDAVLALAEQRGENVTGIELVGQSLGGTEAEAIAAKLESRVATPIVVERVSTVNAPKYISYELDEHGELVRDENGNPVLIGNALGDRTFRYDGGIGSDIVPEDITLSDVPFGDEGTRVNIPPQTAGDFFPLATTAAFGSVSGALTGAAVGLLTGGGGGAGLGAQIGRRLGFFTGTLEEHKPQRTFDSLVKLAGNLGFGPAPSNPLSDIYDEASARNVLRAQVIGSVDQFIVDGLNASTVVAGGLFQQGDVIVSVQFEEENGRKIAVVDEVLRTDENGDSTRIQRSIVSLDANGVITNESITTISIDPQTGERESRTFYQASDFNLAQPTGVEIVETINSVRRLPDGSYRFQTVQWIVDHDDNGQFNAIITVKRGADPAAPENAVDEPKFTQVSIFDGLDGVRNYYDDIINAEISASGERGYRTISTSSQIGASFGSSLANHFFADSDVFTKVLAQTAISSVGQNLFEALAISITRGESLGGSLTQALSNFDVDLQANFQNASIGAVSSYLTAELVDALGLSGFGGELASTVGNTVINQALTNIATQVNPFDNIIAGLPNAVGSFLGSKLANQVVSADTVAGQLGGSIGGSLGSIAAGQILSKPLQFLGFAAGPVGALIGAFLGTILGTLIGDLFGKTPRSGADLVYDPDKGQFSVGAAYKKGKGSKEAARSLAGQVGETLNGVIGLTGGILLNPSEVEPGYYGTYKSDYTYRTSRNSSATHFKEAGALVTYGVLNALKDVEILGGDIYIKRALSQSIENQFGGGSLYGRLTDGSDLNDPEIEILLGDITIAQDYAAYNENAPIINALIAASPDSAFAAGWVITLQRAYELGLHRRAASDWHGGWDLFLDGENALIGTIDLSLDASTGERLVSFIDIDGVARTVGDTVDSLGKDDIQGTAGADTIIVNGVVLDESASTAGLTVNGEALTTDDFEIDGVAAIHGGDGDDIIWGGDRGNDVFGDAGNDTLYGGKTADWLFGGDGNDTLDANISDDGNYLNGGAGDDNLIGRAGSDWLDGGDGADTLDGGDGDDFLAGGEGAGDIVRGGRGDDKYLYDAGDGADVLSDEGFDQAAPERPTATVDVALRYGPQTFDRFEALNLGYIATDWSGESVVAATSDGKAQGGEDALVFGEGIALDSIRIKRDVDGAGVADDLLIEILDSNGDLTSDVVRLSDWFDPFNRVEWLEFADGQRIRIGDFLSFTVGTAGADVIIGTNGNDFVHGGAGNDIIHLLMGDDVGNGGLGDDSVSGDGGDDLVLGGNDDDLVLGGAGNDVVSGDLGDDVVRGDGGDDLLSGGLGDDVVVGGAGDDVIRYNRGDGFDTILDAYDTNGWEVVFDGVNGWVAGVATANVDHDNDPTTGLVTQVTYNGDVLYDGATWNGIYRFDTQMQILERHTTGDAGDAGDADILEFAIGIDIDDIVFQSSGNDLLMGINNPFSDDTAFVDLVDKIRLQDWNAGAQGIEHFAFFNTGLLDLDSIALMRGGTDGDDTLAGAAGNDWLTGGTGDDAIAGAGGDDILVGHAGNDRLTGGAGSDTLLGGSGDDVLEGGEGADKLVGGAGFDIASYASATGAVVVRLTNEAAFEATPVDDVFASIEGLEGSNFADTLTGDGGDNELIGGAGDDRLEGRDGDDSYLFRAGDGQDTIFDRGVDETSVATETAVTEFGAVGDAFTESFTFVETRILPGGVTAYVYDWTLVRTSDGLLAYSEERLSLTPMSVAPQLFNNSFWQNGFAETGQGEEVTRLVGASSFYDGGSDNLVWDTGDSFSNMTFSYAGDDLLIASANGSVRIEDFTNVEARVEEISLSDGIAANLGGLLLNTNGAGGDDFIVGTGGDDTLTGGDGADVVTGGDGSDTLSGDAGDDVLEGGAGADVLDGGDGIDVARYLGSSAGVTVDLALATGVGGEAQGDTFTSVEVLHGSQFGDSLTGDGADNRLFGHDGNDTLTGAAGNDVLIGGLGADIISGGLGDDNLDGAEGADNLDGGNGVDALLGGAGDDQLDGGAGNDFLSGEDGNDVLEGGLDNDLLAGDAGADTLRGDAGDDTLIGGEGNDQLEGGAGDDVYAFDPSSGDDIIVDNEGVNKIAFSGVTRDDLRFDRVGDSLVIKVVGSLGSVTLSDHFLVGGTSVHTISAGEHILYFDHAQPFFDMFVNLPSGASELDAAISAELDSYWHLFGNARPEGADIALSVDEDSAVVGTVITSDHDENITGFYLSGSPANGSVVVNAATGEFTYTPDPDFNGDDAFFINIEDDGGNLVDVLVSVAVAPINDAPTEVYFDGALNIVENTSDITLGNLSVADVDGTEGEHTFSIDDARFEVVDETLRLRPGIVVDHEAEPTITVNVTATDGSGLSNTPTSFVFDVNDLNESQSQTPSSFSIDEDALSSAVVGTVTAIDPDQGTFGDLRYFFQSTAGAAISVSEDGLFTIDEISGAVSLTAAALDYEAQTSYTLTSLVRDNAGLAGFYETTSSVDIAVNNINESPTAISIDNQSIDENADGAIVGALSATDLDGPAGGLFSQHAFTVDDARFFVDGADNLRLKTGESLNFESEPTVNLLVTVTDLNGNGLSFNQTFAVSVNDLIDEIYGSSANDAISGEQGVDHIFGLGGDDVLIGNDGDDLLDGDTGNDVIEGGDGADQLFGRTGNDDLSGHAGDDTLDGGDGDDLIDGGNGIDVLLGGNNNDTLYGRDGDDDLQGGAGNDVLAGGVGSDTLNGGDGEDIASYEDAAAAVGIDLSDVTQNTGDANGDTYTSIEVYKGSEFDDTFTGDAAGNTFYGLGGNDTLLGDGGNDALYGGDGDDFIDAGDGADMLDGGAGADILVGGADQDIYFIDRSSGADTIRNYDPENADDVISFADDIGYTDLWFERIGDDLVISVIDSSTVATIEDWYLSVAAGNAYDISLFLVDERETRNVDAEQLVSVMAQYLVDESVVKPTTAVDMTAALSVIGGEVDALWGFSTPPTIDTLSDVVINEDGTVTFTARIYDDKVAAELLTVGATSSDDTIVAPFDVVYGQADAQGYRQVTVTPVPDASGQVVVTLQATDGGSGIAEEPFTLTVNAQADTPSLAVFSASGNAGSAIALNIAASQTDIDLSETLTIEISGIPTGATLNAGADLGGGVWSLGVAGLTGLELNSVAGDATDFALSVTVTSAEGGTTASTTAALNVTVNGAPSDIDFSGTIDENTTNGTIVGDASHTDPDSGGSHVYSLVNDAGGRFDIDGATGQVSVLDGGLLNHESNSAHTIRIRVVDQGGLAREEDFTIDVDDVNEVFSFDAQTLSIAENSAVDTLVGSHIASDPDDGDFGSLRYHFEASGGGVSDVSTDGRFKIDTATGAVSVHGALDFENANSFTYNVVARDNAGAVGYFEDSEALTINVTNVNEAPTDIVGAGAMAASEAAGNGAVVADFNHADPEGGTMAYTLTNNAGGRFAINGTSGVLTVANAGLIDFEAASSHAITVKVTDTGGLSRTENFTIGVTNVNEAPTVQNFVVSVVENSAAWSTVLGRASFDDPDSGDVLRLFYHDPANPISLSDPNAADLRYEARSSPDGKFYVNPTSGSIYNKFVINYEESAQYTYTLAVADQSASPGALVDYATLTVNVIDQNEAPNVNNKTFSPAETWNPTVAIGTLSFSDPDLSSVANGQLSFSIISGNTGNKFNIDNSGRIWLNSALDYENASQRNFALNVRVRDRNGSGLYDNATVNINVQDVNETPIVTNIEHIPGTFWAPPFIVDTVQRRISAFDPDGDAVSYSIVPGSPNAQSVSVDATGLVSATAEGNFTAHVSVGDGTVSTVSTVQVSLALQYFYGYPVVLDLDGDGIELLELSYEGGGVPFDLDADGFIDQTGWVAPDDGLLALDRNGNGTIDNGLEISFVDDLDGATTDLEGLAAFDTNENGFLDSGDARWGEFYVWQDANSDGISQAVELRTLDQAEVAALSLTRNLTGDDPNPTGAANVISATSQYVKTDGTVFETADVAFAVAGGNYAVPIVLDLEGDGLGLTTGAEDNVFFDADGDGVKERIMWLGEGDGLLSLDRNANGAIDDISEISFLSDTPGATSDLEGLRAFDSNGDGVLSAQDERFSDFTVWVDGNRNALSEDGELLTLEEAGVLWIDLAITSTGASLEGSSDFVVTGISNYVTTDGDIRTVGDVAFRYDEVAIENAPSPITDDLSLTSSVTTRPFDESLNFSAVDHHAGLFNVADIDLHSYADFDIGGGRFAHLGLFDMYTDRGTIEAESLRSKSAFGGVKPLHVDTSGASSSLFDHRNSKLETLYHQFMDGLDDRGGRQMQELFDGMMSAIGTREVEDVFNREKLTHRSLNHVGAQGVVGDAQLTHSLASLTQAMASFERNQYGADGVRSVRGSGIGEETMHLFTASPMA